MPEIEPLARYSIFVFFTILQASIFSQSYPEPKVDVLIKKGIEFIMEQNYEEANITFNALDKAFPNLPFGKLYLSAVLITKANDLAIPLETEKIKKYLDDAEDIIETTSERNMLWYNYSMGLVRGYRAYFESLQGRWFSTFTDGISAVNYFEKCLKIDSSFNDAKIVIGTYKYWKSVKAAWLPFFADESGEGFALLNKGIEKESYNFASGVISLLWIYIDKKKFSTAITLAEETLKKYPKNRNYKWALARAYEDVNLSKAIELHYELLASYASVKQANRINEITLKHKIAQDYERIGDRKKALQLCNEILSVKKFTPYEKQKLEERLERVIALKTKLLSLEKEK